MQELKHYGVLGMKWGRRRASTSTSTPHEDSKRSWEKMTVSSMSNAELKKRIRRLEMEKKYADLNPAATKPGKKLANEILGNAGKQVATEITKKTLTFAVKTFVTSMANKGAGGAPIRFLKNVV